MKPGLSGRADLLRALTSGDPALATSVADLLGYEETPALQPRSPRATSGPSPVLEPDVPADVPYAPVDIPFWRLERFEAIAFEDIVLAEETSAHSTRTAADPVWRSRPASTPPFTPLAPKRAVLTRLRQESAMRRTTPEIDLDAVVERLSRHGLLDKVPRRQRRAWGSTLYIIEDRARRLVPYWRDQDYLVDVLREIYPPGGLIVARLGAGETHPMIRLPAEQYGQYANPLPGTMVLVLGDLGCLATRGEAVQRFWLQWGRDLRQQRLSPIALVPARARDILPELARTWIVIRWDAASPARLALSSQTALSPVQHVLTLLAPVVRLEPGLLRAVRVLIPEGRRDPGLEARVWQDPAVLSQHSRAATLDPQHRQAYLARFAREPEPLRQAVLHLLRGWRGDLHAAVWFEEIVGLDRQSQQELVDTSELEDARTYLQVLADRLEHKGTLPVATAAWIECLAERLPAEACQDAQVKVAVHRLYDLVRSRSPETQVPAWFDPAVVSPPGQSVRQFALWQVGEQLLFQPLPRTAEVRGSLLGLVHTSSGEITLPPRVFDPGAFWQDGRPPAWASDWGWDAFGPWATFRLGAVEQRLRWMPPGRFLMGSPDDEAGRWEDEGLQHEVELTQGFWLFDTPCTQALWQEVMGTNPSRFKGANRPVEQVSWDDIQEFLRALNARLPDLDLRLPTEAQWEYACRAGTTTARYEADLEAIAWYADNSQREMHEVAQKRPNAWGLYDMLGNVDEWCYDGMRDYTETGVIDPVGPTAAGAGRAVRGGSWGVVAQGVRAAHRFAVVPGVRLGVLGFRGSSSGGSQPVQARAAWRVALRQAEPAETATQQPAVPLVSLPQESSMAIGIPPGDGFLVHSDRERLSFGQIIRPSWAAEIGRDVYGLWVTFDVAGVRQRLRWIPPGRFWMGSPGSERGRDDDEGPQHDVILTQGFWLFDTPCTQALWQAVMGTNPSYFEGAKHPVENVSWDTTQEFLGSLNKCLPGLNLCLPTEAQWEYACRAGTTTSRYETDLRAIAWYGVNSRATTHEVGQKRPNAWGLYDMLGNVWEWCYDGMRHYTETSETDPVGPSDAGAGRAIRGGGWDSVAQVVRAAYRDGVLGCRGSSAEPAHQARWPAREQGGA
jgi:formylglycine-generating enzyme required for sulfatase activity